MPAVPWWLFLLSGLHLYRKVDTVCIIKIYINWNLKTKAFSYLEGCLHFIGSQCYLSIIYELLYFILIYWISFYFFIFHLHSFVFYFFTLYICEMISNHFTITCHLHSRFPIISPGSHLHALHNHPHLSSSTLISDSLGILSRLQLPLCLPILIWCGCERAAQSCRSQVKRLLRDNWHI